MFTVIIFDWMSFVTSQHKCGKRTFFIHIFILTLIGCRYKLIFDIFSSFLLVVATSDSIWDVSRIRIFVVRTFWTHIVISYGTISGSPGSAHVTRPCVKEELSLSLRGVTPLVGKWQCTENEF